MLNFNSNSTVEGQARQLARHYPTGKLWVNKFKVTDSVLGKLVLSLSGEWLRFQNFCQYVMREIDLDTTDDLLSEWEKSVGIPNAYFTNTTDIETRRLQVLLMLTDFGGAQTQEDFDRIAELFGFSDVTIRSGTAALFPLSLPMLFFSGDGKGARNTVYITLPSSTSVFPMAFPLPFAIDSGIILERIFRVLLPATTDIIFLFGDV